MTDVDRVERLGGSRIQHGPANARVYLMRLDPADLPELPDRLASFARARGYGKVFAKVPAARARAFRSAGYAEEARVPGYYRGRAPALFMALYTDPARARADQAAVEAVLAAAEERAAAARTDPPDGAEPERLGAEDADEAAALYRAVFETYPFPIHDPDYLRETLRGHVAYYGLREGGRLLALASAEKDAEAKAAELTDFATHPEARGRGFAARLLARMERDLAAEGYVTGYTIARARSRGMNIAFARAGYRFGGTLWNNTQICGRLESMNVWHRGLSA